MITSPGRGPGAARRAAFFDVDETLITAKSMFEFLRYWLARNGDDGTDYRRRAAELLDIAARGLPRAEGNRAYYLNFKGAPCADVAEAGRAWYADYREGPGSFVSASLSALARHRTAGDLIVLVSGSFGACLGPLAADLAADLVLCSDPSVAEDGTFTGEVTVPMIGAAKADAVARTIRERGLNAQDCFAYGDHVSDLEMLLVVGNPVVVGADPVLREHARSRDWPVLPATGGRREVR
ncbi:HAD family hydrolase [Microbispora sitophila]|uniref:HAD family hydrolase n=1 Tax=Microbispora sitophila TaxID=2771537 RepID=UPI00299F7F76|nr:HAD-IB family hydrolase [Microbispora sitophila]